MLLSLRDLTKIQQWEGIFSIQPITVWRTKKSICCNFLSWAVVSSIHHIMNRKGTYWRKELKDQQIRK
ncbi:hypothetical protein F2P79_007714 [Pimephales promelas]|nr:hypothetical protein F2P79_007714 [Pimephales promelas]